MKKIIAYIFIANVLSISSISFCMLIRPKQFLNTLWKQQKRYAQTVSKNDRYKLCKKIKTDKEKLRHLLKQDSSNLREIWRLEGNIKKNSRIATSCINKKSSFDETVE